MMLARTTFLVFAVGLWPLSAHAVDEIQVYNGEIAKRGQFTLQQHLNYAINGRKEPDFPGGLVPHRALNGTPELAYGVTDWYEIGLYAPFAVNSDQQFLSNGFKIRHLFVSPNAEGRNFFYGVNLEFSYLMPKFSETKFGIEIRPIIGWRNSDFEFIVNPIVDIGIGRAGEVTFAPAARFARKVGKDWMIGSNIIPISEHSGALPHPTISFTRSSPSPISRSASSTSISASDMA